MRTAVLIAGLLVSCSGSGSAIVVGAVDTGPSATGTPSAGAPGLQLCLNEFMPQNAESWLDDSGAASDWIELHNPTGTAVSLSGWYLTDDPDKPFDAPLDSSLSVPAGGYLVLAADELPGLGPTHLPFALAGEGDAVGLFRWDAAGEVIRFGTTEQDFSWARQPDCCAALPDCVVQSRFGTPGEGNGG